MKLLIAFCISTTLIWAAGGQKARKPAQSPASKPAAAKPPQAIQIPKDAVEFEPGTFRHTDAKGKKWIYRKTPFGVARLEDKPAAAAPDLTADFITAVDAGDSVRFERPGPFGTYRWERKKTELNDTEKAAWERERAKASKQE